MQLNAWMTANGVDDEEMAKRIRRGGKVKCDRTMVNRYRRKLRRPEWDVIDRIKSITNDQVGADDFLYLEAAE